MTSVHRPELLLRVIGGTKIYQGSKALNDVDFDVYLGEVHGLVGENGAGKSTLCKALAGAISLTSGKIFLDGEEQNFKTPADALAVPARAPSPALAETSHHRGDRR